MIEFFDVDYNLLPDNRSNELFSLRKTTFKDRLNWIVNCERNMEFDAYDNKNTTYLFGVYQGLIVCSLRFIETQHPTMIIDTFKPYFPQLSLPDGNFTEASRLFIDKSRIQELQLRQYPISSILFLSMINYARDRGYEGIYAIVSHPMMIIFQRSGWQISIVETGLSEKKQNIYLIHMPVDSHNQQIMIDRINQKSPSRNTTLNSWPLSFPIGKHRPDELQLNAKPDGMFSVGNA